MKIIFKSTFIKEKNNKTLNNAATNNPAIIGKVSYFPAKEKIAISAPSLDIITATKSTILPTDRFNAV